MSANDDADDDETLSEQPRRESRCPECGAEATEQSLARHSLSAVGYLHDDQMFECSECGHDYPHGVPVGEFDGQADDLWCDVCNLGFMRVHRTQKQNDGHKLHLKCPHHHPLDCPNCGDEIPADGVTVTRNGTCVCPFCEESMSRSDVPFCFYFRFAERTEDSGNRSLVGYPDITGNLAAAEESYGYDASGTVPCPNED